ncbi:type II toxin-antitoxin system MqsA family antitoxin [Acinetobacter pittii]|uniref:type II toxin-antitoxin system MqsA family antitoxin n=1 Tax=Acinetobacter pittii TaxID=48296 RepID=UPI000838E0BF|nr:type II toxin-antitoxin system MqsA family antitoxin [Acinetobacter pittii]EKV9254356.1 type II toxin-antitoxin system MqsA family antitoxin [Acinetobacter baumannii]ELA8042198.1 type II toxin-antitoxin system MqsA family antitoxin [Acinetobacter baumannii]ELA8057491.1 type II toxin-antitoxin system MqsA family antitoxin [Acinetobacter baumannii]ELA9257102.1 type II toxin-antitoxin system MqsA family antitoxin [Acinetobacter baumannii]EMB4614721.1 type II toxin-antitoxin system MqsA family 
MLNHTCVMCDEGLLIKKTVIDNVDFKGQVLKVPNTHLECNLCGCIELDNEYMKVNNRALNIEKKKALDLFTGSEIKEIREGLRLSQTEASAIFGGGKVAFSKYENDDVIQSKSMNTLIGAANRIPDLLPYLISQSSLSNSPKFQGDYEDVYLEEDFNPLVECKNRPSIFVVEASQEFDSGTNGYTELQCDDAA